MAKRKPNTIVQIVPDHTGDTRTSFATADPVAMDDAERRFTEITGRGFRAAALTEDGTPGTLLKKFDPTVERTLFIPNLQGG